MKILAHILAMADSEVLGLISPRTIKDIKREDPSPIFKVFRVGQEGESRPHIVGVGATVQRWFQSAIEKLTEKLRLGIPVYHNHGPTNASKNRQAIGEIVGKALKKIEGSLSSIAVAYIYPQFKDLPLDVASIEADVMAPQDSKEFDIKDVDITEVTGIALGNSMMNKPAFPGATLLAQLQAFAEKPHQGDNNMTLDEIQKAIQEGKFKPSDVFAPTVLTSDPFIKEHVEEKINNAKGYDIRKRQDLEEKVSTLEKDKKTLQDELASSKTSVLKTKAKESFEAVLAERPKLKEDVRLVKFIRKSFEKSFAPMDETKVKDELNRFVDGQVVEFAELMGEGKPGDGKEKTDAEKVAEATAAAAEEKRDKANLLDPKNNELIPV
jgi:DNA-binding transcriptional MerR regulator